VLAVGCEIMLAVGRSCTTAGRLCKAMGRSCRSCRSCRRWEDPVHTYVGGGKIMGGGEIR
jgi:hypothetical protein